jgi:hypothetical protein
MILMFKERVTHFLLHHKYIEFDLLLFHNIVIVQSYLSRCNSQREEGGCWYSVDL